MIETRFYARGAELRQKDGKPYIVGRAAVFYDPDDPGTEFELWPGVVERIAPGAFDDVLAGDTVVNFNHDNNELIGRTTSGTAELRLTAGGLDYRADASGEVGRRVAEYIRRGDVSGSSFRFTLEPQDVSWDDLPGGRSIRTITRVARLWDVGPVVFPAYEATTADLRAALAGERRRCLARPGSRRGRRAAACAEAAAGAGLAIVNAMAARYTS